MLPVDPVLRHLEQDFEPAVERYLALLRSVGLTPVKVVASHSSRTAGGNGPVRLVQRELRMEAALSRPEEAQRLRPI